MPLLLAMITATTLGLVAAQPADGNWTLHKLSDAAAATGAVCLDGSPAAYYYREPLTSPPAGVGPSFVVFMEGGGWCMMDDNCLQRAGTDLGSSHGYPAQIGGAEATGLYDAFPFATIVYAKYCDGSSFTGDVAAPVSVNNATGTYTIYYRGRRVFDALFDELFARRGLDKATELLFAGCSAGALTAYTHADYVSQLMAARAPGAKVAALGDAMFSLHHDAFPAVEENYYTRQFTWGFDAWNSSASVNQACLAAHPGKGNAWVCFHGAVASQYVVTPLFIANSKYDTWQRAGVLSLNATECPGGVTANGTVELCSGAGPNVAKEEDFWLAYGQAMIDALAPLSQTHAAFLTNCPTHCQTSGPGWRHPAFPGTRLDAAVKQWYADVMSHSTPGRGVEAGWTAPRWIAQQGQSCITPPQ